ncbi:unnamed protein product [Discosporangium mesarthrocarpum]
MAQRDIPSGCIPGPRWWWDAEFAPDFGAFGEGGGQFEHQAGYDAHLTGSSFVAAALFLGASVEELRAMGSNGAVPPGLTGMENRLPLFRMLGDVSFHLPGPSPPPDPELLLHISGFGVESRTSHICRPLNTALDQRREEELWATTGEGGHEVGDRQTSRCARGRQADAVDTRDGRGPEGSPGGPARSCNPYSVQWVDDTSLVLHCSDKGVAQALLKAGGKGGAHVPPQNPFRLSMENLIVTPIKVALPHMRWTWEMEGVGGAESGRMAAVGRGAKRRAEEMEGEGPVEKRAKSSGCVVS